MRRVVAPSAAAALFALAAGACTATLDFNGISGAPADAAADAPDVQPGADGGDAGAEGGPSTLQPDDLWLLDEGSGTTAGDSAGAHPGTTDAEWTQGLRGSALAFSFSSLKMASLNGGAFPTEGTLTFYANLDSVPIEEIFDQVTGDPGLYVERDSGQIGLGVRTASAAPQVIAAVEEPAEDVWFRIAIVWSSAAHTASITLSGDPIATQTQSGALPSTFSLTGERFTFGETFGGKVDEIRLFRRALSVNELAAVP